MDRSSPISYMVQDTASIQSFLHMITLSVPRPGVTDLYTMYDKIHWEGSAESAKAQLD